MSTDLTFRIKPYIQPFERRLALAELVALTGGSPKPLPSQNGALEFVTASSVSVKVLANRLAYWEQISTPQNERLLTVQVLREATSHAIRSEASRALVAAGNGGTFPIPNRRCLRYGPHGLHEYRGKYFPQLVRALLNISGAAGKAIVADPMSGSGTTAVEAMLSGLQSVGTDMNPLSVFMGRTKCAVLGLNPTDVARAADKMIAQLQSPKRRGTRELAYLRSLPEHDQEYLSAWFSPRVLRDLDTISSLIGDCSNPIIRDFFRLSLSNILRSVSWQKEDDLRVRKEIREDAVINTTEEFIREFSRSAAALGAFLDQIRGHRMGSAEIRHGDARNVAAIWKRLAGKVDVVVTSPPYATALPYLDTDRLSLTYLGLLPRSHHRQHDLHMIGNREVSNGLRRDYWERFQSGKGELPGSVASLIQRINRLNQGPEAGFRRRNLPALLSKYFFDMKEVLAGIKTLLRPGTCAFVVVGNNHTIAGGQRVEIHTAKLLADVAETIGLQAEDSISMEMLISRDIFKKNATRTEEIVVLRRPV